MCFFAVKPLWLAAKCWEETLRLLSIAETNNEVADQNSNVFIARRKGILRPVVSLKNMSVMNDVSFLN